MKNDKLSYHDFIKLSSQASSKIGAIPYGQKLYGFIQGLFKEHGNAGSTVLDYGCGTDKYLKKIINIQDKNYFTCDNDTSGSFNYTNAHQIPADVKFDFIFATNVFEHMEFSECVDTAIELGKHIADQGIFFISVPNPLHPTRQNSDPTHKTALNCGHLYALFLLADLKPIYCARCNKKPMPRWWQRPIINMACRVFRMDWCDGIYAVAKGDGAATFF